LKDEEKSLLLDQGVLESYYRHLTSHDESLLSRYFGVYTIRIPYMAEITCFIMDNLLGQDFLDIERIYDLKGSTKGRRAKLTKEEMDNPTGLRVLKDLNFIELDETLQVGS
jgi:hypothetical protein